MCCWDGWLASKPGNSRSATIIDIMSIISSLSEEESEADMIIVERVTCVAGKSSVSTHDHRHSQLVSDEAGNQLDLLTVNIYPH